MMHSHFGSANSYVLSSSLNPCCNGWCTRTKQCVFPHEWRWSLNPCCNGWCTRTTKWTLCIALNYKRLNPCCNGWCTRTMQTQSSLLLKKVLILVVMDDALVQWMYCKIRSDWNSLNPCCNGWCTRTLYCGDTSDYEQRVLILVVMDDALVQSGWWPQWW